MEKQRYIPAGKIVNTHGVGGEVKIEVWLDSPQFLRRFPRVFLNGTELEIESSRAHKGFLLAKLRGVDDVNAAMTLKGKELSVDRDDVRLPRGSYYLQDILGATVVDEQGREIGRLTEVLERPASNIYVVQGESEHLIPAVPEFVLSTDAEAGLITVRLIEGM